MEIQPLGCKFKENEDEKLLLILDLVALPKVDGEVHITEKMFIKNIEKTLEFDKGDLEELLK